MAFSHSTVADLIEFDPLENLEWSGKALPPIDEMLEDIVLNKNKWLQLEATLDAGDVAEVKKKFQLRFVTTNTDHPRDESDPDEENMLKGLHFFDQLGGENESGQLVGLIEYSIIQEAHNLVYVAKNIAGSKQMLYTPKGKFSENIRLTEYKGEQYVYPHPPDMKNEVDSLLDRYNSLFTHSVSKSDEKHKLSCLFKTVGWLLFELLDLHPFGDGNGRVCRLVCSYVLSTISPFPSPVYNGCTDEENGHSRCPKPCKDCYEQALVDARKSADRRPKKITAMIIAGNYITWKNFLKEVQDTQDKA